MKTFNFTKDEKYAIMEYLLSHRMKRKENYSDTEWEKIKKQRIRARKEIKGIYNRKDDEMLSRLNFDTLTVQPRIGIDDNGLVFHIPVDEKHMNEEITNLLRKLSKMRAKYVW